MYLSQVTNNLHVVKKSKGKINTGTSIKKGYMADAKTEVKMN